MAEEVKLYHSVTFYTEMYTTGEASKRLGVSFLTVKRWVYSGKLKAIRMPSGRWMIPEVEVRRLKGGRNPEIQTELRTIARIVSWMLKSRFRDAVVDVMLFGSAARGEAEEGSDVDLLVVINDNVNESEIERELGDLTYDMMLATGRFVQLLIYRKSEFEDARSWNPTVWNILREGIKL